MKHYKQIRKELHAWLEQNQGPDNSWEELRYRVQHAWLLETLCTYTKLTERDAAKLVDRYIDACREVGVPLMTSEVNAALIELLKEGGLQGLLDMTLEQFKVSLAMEAEKSMRYALGGDSAIAEALGY